MGVATVWNLFAKHSANAETKKGEDESSLTQAGDFKLDLRTRTAVVRERRLDLTQDEFDLLHYLLSHRRKLVTPRTVLSTPQPDTSVVRRADFLATLLTLRKKLAAVSNVDKYLLIEPWVLYSFNPAD